MSSSARSRPPQVFDVVVVGAGAAGMMCAIEAGKRGRRVRVIDHARAPGEKIRSSGGGRCNFTAEMVVRYRTILSGPLLDRIDLHVIVAREPTSLREPSARAPGSAEARQQVMAARERQQRRQGCCNSQLNLDSLHQHCRLDEADRRWLEQACEQLQLSLRASHRILKVARTLADLDSADDISRKHLAEALQYRIQLNS